ncbi:MAG: DUF1772 domain-containing protein, partial [Bosea sp. (in: a-proteobacteria)]
LRPCATRSELMSVSQSPAVEDLFWPSVRRSGLMLSALLMAAIAGFFYAYAVSVIRGLDQLPPQDAIRAMQGINATVRNAWFAPSFFGALIVTGVTAVLFLAHRRDATALLVLGAAALYGLGGFYLTMFWNVPLNNELALRTIPLEQAAALEVWLDYREPWMVGNTARLLVSFSALILLLLALQRDARTDR